MHTSTQNITPEIMNAHSPKRIRDLLWAHSQGHHIACTPELEIVPADFFNQGEWTKGYIFLCRFRGSIDNNAFNFRKCYTKGLYQNFCQNVMNAAWVANRYLKKDYSRFKKAGFEIPENLFTLQDFTLRKCMGDDTDCPPMTIYDFIYIADEGNQVLVEVMLDKIMAFEHHPDTDLDQIFFIGDFKVIALGKISRCQRCLANYPAANEDSEAPEMIRIANKRLQAIYYAFKRAGICYNERFFTSP